MLQRLTIQLLNDAPLAGRASLRGCHLGQFGQEAVS